MMAIVIAIAALFVAGGIMLAILGEGAGNSAMYDVVLAGRHAEQAESKNFYLRQFDEAAASAR